MTRILFVSLCFVFLSISCIQDPQLLQEDMGQSFDSLWSLSGHTFSHDPSCIYAEGKYWQFHTADGIGLSSSADGRHWSYYGSVFDASGSYNMGSLAWWSDYVPSKDDWNIWAPEIVYKDGYYWLYYSISTFGSKISAIGLARSSSISVGTGNWEDMGLVINSSHGTAYNCIDPGVVADSEGNFYLSFGSWSDGIYIVSLDETTMVPETDATPVQIADRDLSANAIEGAYIWNGGNGYYYLFVAFDSCCNGASSTYKIYYGRSESPTGEYLDKEGNSLLDNGGSLLIQADNTHKGPGGPGVFTDASGEDVFCFFYYPSDGEPWAELAITRFFVNEEGWIDLK